MNYSVLLSARAQRELRDLPPDILKRLDSRIVGLAADPRPDGSRKLRARTPESWRIRVGDYRILYGVDDTNHRVIVYRVGHRRDIYE